MELGISGYARLSVREVPTGTAERQAMSLDFPAPIRRVVLKKLFFAAVYP
ncbi:hypothetical protein [Eisenbergiella sp.]